ncbi:MAG: PBP1A family penicillin-binding protein [Clostridium sp.]|nr:PBP1A family penicillin-binding protein [Clostridium sp.]
MNSKTKTTRTNRQKSNAKRVTGNILRITFRLFKLTFITLALFSCLVGGVLSGMGLAFISTAEELTRDQIMLQGFTTRIYDCNDDEIMTLQGDLNREMVEFKDIPKDLRHAFIAIEDKRFDKHPGIDFIRIGGAVSNFLSPGASLHGGSTITQQVIKNLTGNDERSVKRKVQEWWIALHLERKLSKDDILELYLNLIYMGQNCYGVQAASHTYFNKDVSELTLAECASLAGITNLPSMYDPFFKKGKENNIKRQKIILKEMLEQGYISQGEYDTAIKEELNFADINANASAFENNQPYFIDQVVIDIKNDLMKMGYSEELAIKTIYNNGLKIYTTMDPQIQKIMDDIFQNEEYFTKVNKKTSQTPQASMVIMDGSGYVRALYGGSGKKIGAPLNRASDSRVKRQPGSTFKPIAVYGPALNERKITAATIIDDVPVYFLGKDKSPYPLNVDRVYSGLTTIRTGLRRSVNVVAARVWQEILGPDLSLDYLDRVGINRDDERYLSIALGGPREGVNTLQMAAAYVPFMSQGIYHEPITYTKVLDMDGNVIIEKKPQTRIVYDEATAYIMVDMMKDVIKAGTATDCKIQGGNMPVAGKTGTTGNNFDKWFIGYSPYYVGATWYGYDYNVNIIGAEENRARKIWRDVMEKVHENLEPVDFVEPEEGLVKKRICVYSGKLASELCSKDPRGSAVRVEYFLAGTEPREECNVHVMEKVCKDSTDDLGRSLLAGPGCPHESIEERVFIRRPIPYIPTIPGERTPTDIKYELPAGEYCPVHGGANTDDDDDDDTTPGSHTQTPLPPHFERRDPTPTPVSTPEPKVNDNPREDQNPTPGSKEEKRNNKRH